MVTDSHTYPLGIPWKLGKDHLGYGDEYLQNTVEPSVRQCMGFHRYATKEEFIESARSEDSGYWESGDFIQVPNIYDEDQAFIFKWWFLGDTLILELYDVILG